MSERQEEYTTKKKSTARPIGGIGQYTTIGGGTKRSEPQIIKSLDVQTSSIPAVETDKSSSTKKSKHPDWKQLTAYIPPLLLKWLRGQAVEEEREMSEIVAEALENYRNSYQQ